MTLIPHRTPFFLPWLYPSLTWRMPANNKTLYLTFDDGPVEGPTEYVLDVLQHYQAQATFFCIGDNIRKYPQIFRTIIDRNHTVGNHTYHHVSGWQTSVSEYVHEVQGCEDEIAKFIKPSRLFRPPYGRISRKQIVALDHYDVIMWDVLSLDYKTAFDGNACAKGTVKAIRDGSIIVFHDSLKAEKNLKEALPRVLEKFSKQGYHFKSLSSV